MTTFGDMDDLKHFLPRILELHALDYDGAHYELDVILGKLNYARWNTWPDAEIHAIQAFVNSWLKALIYDDNELNRSCGDIDRILSTFDVCGFDYEVAAERAVEPGGEGA